MVSASKILTVSYGTFSCTLEGFDDPFSTMRSIAEYFRDLAADDRYFGAEPPQPDAEMLHRIAERELRRPVNARFEENNLILRQSEETDLEPAKESVAVAEEAVIEAEPEAKAQPAAPKPTKAERKAERQAKQAKKNRQQRQAEKAAAQEEKARANERKAQKAQAAERAAAEAESQAAPAPKQPAANTADLSDASIAAKLMRIRAVVENEDNADGSAEENDAIDPAQSADFYASIRKEAADEAGMLDEDLREPLVDADAKDAPQNEADESLLSRVADAADIYEEDAEDLAQEAASEALDEIADDLPTENAFGDDEDEGTAARDAERPVAIARVVKVRKPQPAAAQEAKQAETPAKARTDDADASKPHSTSSLSAEDEAALIAELAEVERDSLKQSGQDQEEATPQTRTAFDDGDIAGADAIDRILAETDAKLMSDEANQRRASIAHLRAAIQAKRAEEGEEAKASSAAETNLEAFRDDLDQAVHPRRPAARGEKPKRRMAPLVLVSEQRIDARETPPAPPAQAPVRPRRVQVAAQEDASENKRGHAQEFAAFLAEKNPTGAEEMLEAAASFRIFVVGQETFSRPQVMGLVLKSDMARDISREEGLRAFGKLIRDGVIRKIQRGRYTISENTRFRPDQTRVSA